MSSLLRTAACAVSLVALATAAPPACQAQAWPTKPVRVVATFPPGGGADITGRLLGARLGELWKQPVIVENRTGAGGSVGAELVSRATPDGYTLLLVAASHAVNAALLQKLSFDLLRDFKPVALATSAPILLAVNPRVKATTLQEFTGLLRAQPDKLDYASCGMATTHHFTMELYKYDTKTAAVHIPHSCAAAVANAVGGQLDVIAVTLASALPFVQQGRLRALALSSHDRSRLAPDIPTFRDSGMAELKSFAVENYYGLLAPAATPTAVVTKVEADVRQVLDEPDLQKKLANAGLDPFFRSGADTMKLLRTDIERYRRIAAVAGIKQE
ncbi:MAG: tripartite tricarboxylate transporter substrate binding protein [Proteobacteria bacterium]|nr:tripartite tricarboxylate transporter substrate binding protein [Burkholderiales bacterium]